MQPLVEIKNIDLEYKFRPSITVKSFFVNKFTKRQNESAKCFVALKDVSIKFEKGKVYGIIGNNGAGKSTLLKVLAGIISPSRGIIINRAKSVGLLSLGASFNRELTGMENIYLNGLLLGIKRSEISSNIEKIIDFSEIREFIDKPVRTYSSGMVARLAFSIVINLRPQVLLIDEVLSVGDIRFKEKSMKALEKIIKNKNRTIVIVLHNMEAISSLCDEVIWLEKGCVVKIGPAKSVVKDYVQNCKIN